MRRLGVVALLATLPLLRSPPARAHAFLEHAEPRVGTTVGASPPALTLVFTEPVEAAFSRVEVFDQHGKRVDSGTTEHPAPDTLRVPLPPLPPGEYTARWAVVSVDTHATEGSFTFSVKRT
jgi:methionine-rich copper-binding protein CopC